MMMERGKAEGACTGTVFMILADIYRYGVIP